MHYADTVAFKDVFEVLRTYDVSQKPLLRSKLDTVPKNPLGNALRAQLRLVLASDSSRIHPGAAERLISLEEITLCLRHSATTQERDPGMITTVEHADAGAAEAMAYIADKSLPQSFRRLDARTIESLLRQPGYIGLIAREPPQEADNEFLASLIAAGIPGRTAKENYDDAVRSQPPTVAAAFALLQLEHIQGHAQCSIANIVAMAELQHHPDAGIAIAIDLLRQVPQPFDHLHDSMSVEQSGRAEHTIASEIDLHRRLIA